MYIVHISMYVVSKYNSTWLHAYVQCVYTHMGCTHIHTHTQTYTHMHACMRACITFLHNTDRHHRSHVCSRVDARF